MTESLKRYENHRYTWSGSRYESPVDPKRCRASVHETGRSCRSHQCLQNAKHPTDPGGPIEWCTTHSPAKCAEKRKAQEAKWNRETAAVDRRERIRVLAKEVCEAIERGHFEEAVAKASERRDLLNLEGAIRE